jgi:hypothetical protein
MSKLRGVELSFSLDILWRCKVELEKAKYPLFLDKLIIIINKLAKLHNNVRERNGEVLLKRQVIVQPNLGKWDTNLPDLKYINHLLKSIMIKLATQRAGNNFNKILEEITERVEKLYDDYEKAILIINHLEHSVKGLKSNEYNDLLKSIQPKYRPLLKGLRETELIKSPALKDPLKKDLPPGKIASFSNAVQKITTYETDSKAPLVEKGRGLSADLGKKYRK